MATLLLSQLDGNANAEDDHPPKDGDGQVNAVDQIEIEVMPHDEEQHRCPKEDSYDKPISLSHGCDPVPWKASTRAGITSPL